MAKPTLADYKAAGVLDPKPLEPFFLVRGPDGRQFSTHTDEAQAHVWAEKINGTVELYTPVPSTAYQQIGSTYDH